MSALRFALAGAAGGVGAGAMRAGDSMAREAEYDARERDRLDREERVLRLRAELGGGTLGRGSGSRSGADATQGVLAEARMDLPTQMALAGGVPRQAVDDGLAMARGEQPVDVQPVVDDEHGPQEIRSARYTPGEAQRVREQAQRAFYAAMGINDPGHADELAKARRTDIETGLVQDYAGGNTQAGRGAMVSQGKPVMDDGSDVLTGKAEPGSLAAARMATEGTKQQADRAQAGKYSEEAKRERGKREGTSPESINEDLKLLDSERKKITSELADVRAAEKEATKYGDDGKLADLTPRRKALEAQAAQLNNEYGTLRQTLADRRAGKQGALPAAQPKADVGKTADRFEVGKVYRDKAGNRAQYLGGNKWQPLK